MNDIKYFICPMSKNLVDSVLEIKSPKIGLLPTLRQINFDGGYVGDWDTKSFHDYVKNKENIILKRDHCGENQGSNDLYKSFDIDSKYFDLIHIDPWLFKSDIDEGINETIKNINYINKINSNILYEIGTEESIRKFELDELDYFFNKVLGGLELEIRKKILYGVIQSGVKIDFFNKKNLANTNMENLNQMISICKKHNLKSKEHNGDFLNEYEIKLRLEKGLDSINFGPEFVMIENETYLEYLSDNEIDSIYNICLKSNRWKKWLLDMYDIEDKYKLIKVCFHYIRRDLILPDIDNIVKVKLKNRLIELLNYV